MMDSPQSLRAAVTAAYRIPEPACIPRLISEATLPDQVSDSARAIARRLILTLRQERRNGGFGVEALIQEYSLTSREGVALMCLAEALLRIPDAATRDALIRDKLSTADWDAHLGNSPSTFVNAATWGLLITGKLAMPKLEKGLVAATKRLVAKGGEPLVRKGMDLAMRLMGKHFVAGQTIEEALENSQEMQQRGFRYSYDCLGEAASTAADAERYYAEYERAIHLIGRSTRAAGMPRGVYEGPGISVKLSALHPRYVRSQRDRVLAELLPRIKSLMVLARQYDMALNIDAEEADRLDLSLDLLEVLCVAPELAGWNGIGFVIQAYQKRCRFVVDWIIDLARRSRHRLMVRLVKGAYWDNEIKRAQVDGMEGFPVFTRKVYTDISYLACAKTLLQAPDAIFPQFATHNAHTLASILTMAGENFYAGQYEFQCLHGMGERLYAEVVSAQKLHRPCRIYAPVGTHETLLAYLVRRLLENGANTSFVNQIGDPNVPIEDLLRDPAAEARAIAPAGAPHPKIALPRDLYAPSRINSKGLDLTNEQYLSQLEEILEEQGSETFDARPPRMVRTGLERSEPSRSIRSPGDQRDHVGTVIDATEDEIRAACDRANEAYPSWAARSPSERAVLLERTADLVELHRFSLIGLIAREAGKSLPNAIGEIREAVDFLRYYSAQARSLSATNETRVPNALGPFVCISPWNFPLAIFIGQVSAALAMGNTVLAKPAEETPLIAHRAVQLFHEAGIPQEVLQCLPGAGDVGAALVANHHIQGVVFTGSTEVAKSIQLRLADRLGPEGQPIPLVAETGGQNAMVVDSTALPEQVVSDVLTSAFDSAGQRCSALRILCLQEEIADRILTMLRGAMQELRLGNPRHIATDIGPVITREALTTITSHIEAMRTRGNRVEQLQLSSEAQTAITHGNFVPPTLIEIGSAREVTREIFGPVLHVLRYKKSDLPALIDEINATGYGLTFGLHTRIDETMTDVINRVQAGNIYINRNIVGAVVGVQPFGGTGLSGTGPKAGGPRYLQRLARAQNQSKGGQGAAPECVVLYLRWIYENGYSATGAKISAYLNSTPVRAPTVLHGPVGERNIYSTRPRGRIVALSEELSDAFVQLGVILGSGNVAVIQTSSPLTDHVPQLPSVVAERVDVVDDWRSDPTLTHILFAGSSESLRAINRQVAARDGRLLTVQTPDYDLDLMIEEISISTNTAAVGGNAQLMSL
jgi:RHH-type proline utilization regulon transcriptional repressor/proline dehydrogenase/delta 1-pyrroline-5-carboxylate dehydrogenase